MTTLITGARLIDGTGRDPVDPGAIRVGTRIVAVGSARAVRASRSDSIVIDVEGRSVLPALIDCHASMGALRPEERPDGITEKAIGFSVARAVANGRKSLDGGVTTVRVDTVAHHALFAVRDVFAAGWLDGPRMLVPGRAITTTGGHAWKGGAREADGPDAMRKAVREEIKAGADWIKLMPTGGAGTANEEVDEWQMAPDEIAAAVDAAHRRRRRVFAHVSNADAARACAAAGVDSIEHGFYLSEDALTEMKEHGTFFVPTLSAYRHLVKASQQRPSTTDPYEAALQKTALEVVERHARSFRAALALGVRIAAGTDSGADWFPMGNSLQFELELMVSEGMTNADAVAAATRDAADLLGLRSDLGTLEAGKLADILVVDGDPLVDVSVLRKPWLVMKEGRVVFRA